MEAGHAWVARSRTVSRRVARACGATFEGYEPLAGNLGAVTARSEKVAAERGTAFIAHELVLALAAVLSLNAQAEELWAAVNVHSDHYTHNHVSSEVGAFNSDTLGFGIEYGSTPSRSWIGGWYHNSHHKPSIYGGVAQQPLRYGAFKAGGAIGLVSGYEAADIIPLVALIVAYDGERFGANLIATPPIAHWANGALSLQVKARTSLLK
jgi:hypothetical protein